MKAALLWIVLCTSAICLNAKTTGNVHDIVEALDSGAFSDCSFGVKAIYEDGTPIVSLNAERRLNPASNMKILTTSAALSALGRDYRWVTTLACSGEIDGDGILHGDLFIIGGGDPTTGAAHAPQSETEMTAALFASWKKMLSDAGIKAIEGGVAGDGSWISGLREDPTWCYEDIGTYYGTCVSGLNFYENRQDFFVYCGEKAGQPLRIKPAYPETPWMRWKCDCTTGEAGTGDRLYLFTAYGMTEGTICGTYAIDMNGQKLKCRNNYPEYTLAYAFTRFLQNSGITVSKGAMQLGDCGPLDSMRDSTSIIKSRPESLSALGEYKSLPLGDVVYRTNQESDNFYAEMLFRTLGRELKGDTDIKSSTEALHLALDSLLRATGEESPLRKISIHDGSGLSIRDRLTPDFICKALSAMKKGKDYAFFRHSLVKYSSRCVFKTGTMNGCRCLSGYIEPSTPEGKTIIFSIMVNNSPLSTYRLDLKEKLIVNALAAMN